MAADGARASASAKGKSVASGSGIVIDLVDGTSSKGDTAGHKSKATADNPEVVCKNGKRVKLLGPINFIWSHGTKYKVVGFSCGYCGKNISGGGATRFREHLAAISGSVASCENVPPIVKQVMIDQVTNLRTWWSDMEVVLKRVTPLYFVLRYADQQKNASISGFLEKAVRAIHEIRANLSDKKHKNLLAHVMEAVNKRLEYLLDGTLMVAASALDPKGYFENKIGKNQKAKHAVTCAIKKLAPSSSKASAAIDQYVLFRKHGRFAVGEEARKSALSGRLSAADWWDQYGGDYPDLQYFAKRIVGQCMSSSGCERNWSIFALVHTKLRNRTRLLTNFLANKIFN